MAQEPGHEKQEHRPLERQEGVAVLAVEQFIGRDKDDGGEPQVKPMEELQGEAVVEEEQEHGVPVVVKHPAVGLAVVN